MPKYTAHNKEVKQVLREIFNNNADYSLQHHRREYANSKNPDHKERVKEIHKMRYADIIVRASDPNS